MPVNVVAKNIKKLRNAKDISQEDLAKTLNVTRQAISSWENGKTQPDIEMLMEISKALGVEMAELIYGEKPASEYDMFRKDRVKRAIILAAAFLLLILLGAAQNYLKELRIQDMGGIWYLLMLLNIAFTFPLIYGVCGATFLSVLSIWKDIRISSHKARKYLLISGGLITWAYLILIALYFFDTGNFVFMQISVFLISNYGIYIVPGVCLFLGFNGEKTELKKLIIIVSVITFCAFVFCAGAITGPFILRYLSGG